MAAEQVAELGDKKYPCIDGQNTDCQLCFYGDRERQTKEARRKTVRHELFGTVVFLLLVNAFMSVVTVSVSRVWIEHGLNAWRTFAFWNAFWFLYVISHFLSGKSRYVFLMDGHKHVHEEDPRKQLLPTGKFIWQVHGASGLKRTAGISVIEGPILRIRHFGWLVKLWYRWFDPRHAYNGFLEDHTDLVREDSRLTDSSALEDCHFKDVPKLPWGVMGASQMLDFVIQHRSLATFLQRGFRWHECEVPAEDIILAIREYLMASRDRGQSSSVGRHLRELIEESDVGRANPVSHASAERGQRMLDILEGRLASPSGQGTS